jgi:hypothetical protein
MPIETKAVLDAKNMLPPELHESFYQLLAEYRFAALKHHGREWVAPKVIAELMLMGWRSSAPPLKSED